MKDGSYALTYNQPMGIQKTWCQYFFDDYKNVLFKIGRNYKILLYLTWNSEFVFRVKFSVLIHLTATWGVIKRLFCLKYLVFKISSLKLFLFLKLPLSGRRPCDLSNFTQKFNFRYSNFQRTSNSVIEALSWICREGLRKATQRFGITGFPAKTWSKPTNQSDFPPTTTVNRTSLSYKPLIWQAEITWPLPTLAVA
jgi:hypothetical protein